MVTVDGESGFSFLRACHQVTVHFFLNVKTLAHFILSTSSLNVCAQPLPEWEYNGNAEQVGYRVQYSRAGSQSQALIHVIADRLEREFTIEDLEEWTEYEVTVQAVNGIGMGPWSQPVRGRTRESGESAPRLPSSVKNCFMDFQSKSLVFQGTFGVLLSSLLSRK